MLECRGPATEVFGILCQSVGVEPLRASLPAFMAAAFQVSRFRSIAVDKKGMQRHLASTRSLLAETGISEAKLHSNGFGNLFE